MIWRIYHCNLCGEVLAVGDQFPDDGKAKHGDPDGDGVHDDSTLYETPETPPEAGPAAILLWAADQIENGPAVEVEIP